MEDGIKKNNDSKGITMITIAILTIVVAIAGATYAYFSATATNNNTISGTSAYTQNALSISVDLSKGDKTKSLVPQLDSAIQSAVTNNCADASGNAICQVYTITVTNNTQTKYYLTGTLALTASSMDNLKWTTGTSATAGFSGTSAHEKSYTSLASNVALAGGGSTSFYVVIWISEKNEAQSDSGTFTGTVTFDGYGTDGTSGGITSTIRS